MSMHSLLGACEVDYLSVGKSSGLKMITSLTKGTTEMIIGSSSEDSYQRIAIVVGGVPVGMVIDEEAGRR